VGTEAYAIDRQRQVVALRDVASGTTSELPYDCLVLAPGALPVRPPLPGIDLPAVFAVRTIPDSRRIRAWIDQRQARRAVVVGAGFIGLEMAENLALRGLDITLIEQGPQVMPPLDGELAATVAGHIRQHGIRLLLGDGVRPDTALAKAAGLTLGARGGIQVDACMRTSDPRIWAVGDAVETTDVVSGAPVLVALAGPANRQGRIAAASIAGRRERFRGTQATAICAVFDCEIAMTGLAEKALRAAGRDDFACVHLHPGHHAGYFPGATPIHLKVIYGTRDGRILGAQAVGMNGVDKRIDVIAAMIQMRGSVYDLAEAELCYAPQFGAAKDPVNIAGMIAVNALDGDLPLAPWRDWPAAGGVLVDVREPADFAAGHVPGALNAPLSTLRQDYGRLPRDATLWLYCGVGQRSYYAARFLMQQGFDVRSLSGGYQTWRAWAAGDPPPLAAHAGPG
jgi:NADPH-dependent 2,4-dienoyl-CoA reductase/sulfur reductase-like enzyme/rhodanese-related sulfurtransferase